MSAMRLERRGPSIAVSVDELSLTSTRGHLALAATVAASGMAMLDATVVNVALPRIGDDLGVTVSSLQWVLTGYLLALASLILLGGALGDRYGRRRVFLIGTIWFAGASALCGVAPSVEVLIGARVLQGIGAALLTPGSLAILQASFREDDRAKAVGAWSGLGGVAGAAGPLLGGWLVDGPGWRWAFLINLPVAALAVICAHVSVPETRDSHAARSLDIVGAGLAVASLGAATWALTEAGPRGWNDSAVVIAGAAAAVGIVAFVHRMRHARDPLVPPTLFDRREFTVTEPGDLLAVRRDRHIVLPRRLPTAGRRRLVGPEAGTALLPATVLMLVGSARSGALAQRIGPRLQLTAGPIIVAAGLLLLARIGPGAVVDHRRPPWRSRLRNRTRHVRRTAHRNRHGIRQPRARQHRVRREQRPRPNRSLSALSVIPVVSGLTNASGAIGGDRRLPKPRSSSVPSSPPSPRRSASSASDRTSTLGRRHARTYCSVDGPPLQPDPQRCRVAARQ